MLSMTQVLLFLRNFIFVILIASVYCEEKKENDGIKIYKRLIPADVLRGNYKQSNKTY